ncbi:MAG: DUF1349 domain-containing protein [Rhizobium sp.]|nr:DUF1349 domain-containing protein [Rhizobium sp.]
MLRIYRRENLTAFHISEDGQTWDLLRLFRLNGHTANIDLIAQSPTGKGCEARFTQLRLVEGEIADRVVGGLERTIRSAMNP